VTALDLDGDGAIRGCCREPAAVAWKDVRGLEEVEQAGGELEFLGNA